MRFSKSVLQLILIFVAACYTKNVAKIPADDSAILELGDNNNADGLEKRESKNVVNVNILSDDSGLNKRESKNTLNGATFVVDEDSLKESKLKKRAPQNIAHLNLMIDENDLKRSNKLQKRSPKNVVNLDLTIDENLLLSKLVKRHCKNKQHRELNINAKEVSTRTIVKDGKTFTELEISVKDSDLSPSLRSDYQSTAMHYIVVDIPESVVSTISTGYHQLKMDIKSAKKTIQRKLKSIVIPEMGDIYDKDNNLKYTLMPSVKSGTLATALDQEADISIFATYIRDMTDIYSMCNSADEFNINAASNAENMLLLFAPTNEAMINLTAKPWEFPEQISNSNNEESIAQNNIRHFVESHIAKVSSKSFNTGKAVKLESLNGNKIFLKNTDAGFKYRLSESNDWIQINKIDVLDNGALLSVPKVMSWPERTQN